MSLAPAVRSPLLSITVAARNDNFMGDYKWRLSTALNFLGRNLQALDRLKDVEVVICDFNSEVPLHKELPLTATMQQITRFVIIPPSLARELHLEERFPMAVIMNTAIRRSQGEYIAMVDGDTFFTHSSLANFFLILEKKLPIGPPVDQAFCVFSRRQLPVAQTFRKPSVTELDQYLARNRAALKMDPLMAGIGAPAGGVVMHHSLWEHSRAYEQTLIWWGWQDIQLHLRMTQRYPWVDLANFGVDMVHLEHYTDPRRQTQKPMNPMNASPVFEANDANWGLANYDLATARSECLLPEEGLSPPPHVPGTVGSWPCSIKQLTEQYQSEQTRQLVSQVASRCEVPSDEVQALFALAWYALHHHPRTFIEVGAKQGYAAAVVAAGCPGVEIFSIESWQNNISPSTTANVIGFFGQNQSYTRHVSGDPSTAVDRLFSSPFAPETFDLALLRTGPALGDARKNAEELAKRLAAGGTMVVVASTPGAFDPIWQMLQSGYKQFTFVQFSPIGGMMIAAPLVIDTPDAIAAATLQQPAPESAPTGAPAR